MKKIFLILSLLTLLSFTKDENDLLYQNYAKAVINHGDTFQLHLVIKVKNLDNNEIREICTQANSLQSAIHQEYKIDYDDKGLEKALKIALENKSRYFEFKNDSALSYLGIKDYSENDLKELERKINFDSLAKSIKKKQSWSKYLEDKELIMYAHALFNRGILTGENNCRGGKLVFVGPNTPW
ncbi:hypothetical protein C8C83_0052 [Flavobacterium sp. 90]|uniref:hypothetical protein n=1 Tax=unclassified Flavobacterium TaxID=196869 RepID=UPI000EB3A475|nr:MULTISPECIES: hypothetical protein [unclassified Flavobacterium]RKR08468.1 hypothetical protein C8C82_0341 [Flavobacterium sp. 81]TCK52263.1 hypothetical protein C8C83_0052 [Flavobacterium sp. 90]